jgi:hypothetical protein
MEIAWSEAVKEDRLTFSHVPGNSAIRSIDAIAWAVRFSVDNLATEAAEGD